MVKAKTPIPAPIRAYGAFCLGSATLSAFSPDELSPTEGFPDDGLFSPAVASTVTFPSGDSLRTRVPIGLYAGVCDSSKM